MIYPKTLTNFALLFHQAVEKGFLLFGAAISAIIFVNIGFSELYQSTLNHKLTIIPGILSLSIHHIINDFLMAIFFLSVGIEIKREVLTGYLSQPSQRLLPIISAISGVLFPALIYMLLNYDNSLKSQGWAIPIATDIAFVLGVIGLFGKRIPISLRVFVIALAIIDDIIAVIVIAIFYTEEIHYLYLIFICMFILALTIINISNITNPMAYIIIGIGIWFCCLMSGVHATISGIILGIFIPITKKYVKQTPQINQNNKIHNNQQTNSNSIIQQKKYKLSISTFLDPLIAYFIMPIFAFANSGIDLSTISFTNNILSSVTMGIFFGLFLGKQLGIFSITYLTIKLGIVKIPNQATTKQIYAVSILCGIGFTMSLFIGALSFPHHHEMLNNAKMGILLGSFLSLILGAIILKQSKAQR